MANAEHLEILKSGVKQWNEWRKAQNEIRPDLQDVELTGASLSGVDLSRADLSRVEMNYVNLQKADLSFANLYKANLSQTNLSGSNLYFADLTGAYLFNSDLNHADLTGAHLSYSNLSMANLSQTVFNEAQIEGTVFGLTDLSNCKGLEKIEVSGPCVIDFQTLKASKTLPKEFLTKLGIPELLLEYLPDFYNPALMIYPAFLSHSSIDKPFVRKLYDALAVKGVTTWLDEKNLKSGDNLHDSISEGIKHYDKFILVCSENSLSSWWVEKELEKVYEKEREMQKERGKKFRLVIPIRIDDHILNWKEGILTTVRNSMIGDFTQWQDDTAFEKAVKELVDALNANRPDIKPLSFL